MFSKYIKRIIAIVVAILLSATAVMAVAMQSKPEVSGDLNSDNIVDLLDLLAMKKHIIGEEVKISSYAADMNSDDVIDLIDLLYMKKFIIGESDMNLGHTVTIKFDTNGGNSIDSVLTTEGVTLEEYPIPKKESSEFDAWYLNDVVVENDAVFFEDVTLIAKWK